MPASGPSASGPRSYTNRRLRDDESLTQVSRHNPAARHTATARNVQGAQGPVAM
jgi:hypothetical protein